MLAFAVCGVHLPCLLTPPHQQRQHAHRRCQAPRANAGRRRPAPLCRAAQSSAAGESTAGDRLAAWLQQWEHDDCGVRVVPEKDGSGFCAVAKQPIKAGSTLVSVPRAAIILPADVRKAPVLSAVASWARDNTHPDGLSDWQLLCLWLVWQTHLGAESAWAPYMAVVPTEEALAASLAHPLMWPDETAETVLGGSALLGRLLGRGETCRVDLAALREAVQGAAGSADTSDESADLTAFLPKLTERAVRWAAAMVLSRAFYFDETDDWGDAPAETADFGTVALVPWADSLNHSSEAGADSCLGYDPDDREAVLDAHKDYAPGEQVFDSYGPERDPAVLFLDYGFAENPILEPRADLPAALLGEPVAEANRALLCAVGLSPEGATATFGTEGPGEAVLAWARAASATVEELSKAGWPPVAAAVKKGRRAPPPAADPTRAYVAMGSFSEKISDANEREAIERLLAACEAQLAVLDKTREERASPAGPLAEALARTGTAGQAALRVVAGEADALRGSIAFLKEAQTAVGAAA